MFAAEGDGLAEGEALGEGVIEIGDELGGGDDIDIIAHGDDAGNAGIHDLLGQRAKGTDFVVNSFWFLGGGLWFVILLAGRFGVGGAAGVEDQDGNIGLDEEFTEGGAID